MTQELLSMAVAENVLIYILNFPQLYDAKRNTQPKNPTHFIILLFFLLVSSFTSSNPSNFIGTYGVSDANPSQIQLSIYADSSFYYQDFSVADKKIQVNGTWTLRGKYGAAAGQQ